MKKIFTAALLFIPYILFAQSGEQLGNAHSAKPDSISSFAVVELFSSEDCSSCPAADAMVNRVALDAAEARQPVFVLEEHVDYLNNFGWKDTFALKQFEDRQINYQQFFKKGGTYTPQILINGTHEVYAANLSMANLVLEQVLKESAQVTITFSVNNYNDSLAEVDYHLSSTDTNWNITVALIQKIGISHVTAGENSGRTLTHVNVARQLKSEEVTIPDGIIQFSGLPNYVANTYSVIVFVQDKRTMKIIGATQMDI